MTQLESVNCEEWRTIKGYEDRYEVSNFGRVRSLNNNSILKPFKNTGDYLGVKLYKNNIRFNKLLHRLVAQAFIPNPENKPQVNHIDENKTNNIVSNLEWVTAKENINHGTRNERAAKAISKSKSIPIIATNLKTGESTNFNSGRECARALGLDQSNLTKILKGKLRQTGGYTFKYKEDN